MATYNNVISPKPIKNALNLHLNGLRDHIVIEINNAAKAVITI